MIKERYEGRGDRGWEMEKKERGERWGEPEGERGLGEGRDERERDGDRLEEGKIERRADS